MGLGRDGHSPTSVWTGARLQHSETTALPGHGKATMNWTVTAVVNHTGGSSWDCDVSEMNKKAGQAPGGNEEHVPKSTVCPCLLICLLSPGGSRVRTYHRLLQS